MNSVKLVISIHINKYSSSSSQSHFQLLTTSVHPCPGSAIKAVAMRNGVNFQVSLLQSHTSEAGASGASKMLSLQSSSHSLILFTLLLIGLWATFLLPFTWQNKAKADTLFFEVTKATEAKKENNPGQRCRARKEGLLIPTAWSTAPTISFSTNSLGLPTQFPRLFPVKIFLNQGNNTPALGDVKC